MAAKKQGDGMSGRGAVRRGKGVGKRADEGRPDAAPAAAPGKDAGPSPRAGRRPSDVGDDVYVARSGIHGLGMFAARPIRAGVSLGRLAGMPTHDDGTYVLWLTDELGLEVTNDFRFINHDGDPNSELTDVDVVTLRAIATDEELTHDYGW